MKNAPTSRSERFLCWHYLFSHAVARILSSTELSLTSVFGMGTGGPSDQSIPTSSRQAPYPSLPPSRFRVPSTARSFRCLSFSHSKLALNGARFYPVQDRILKTEHRFWQPCYQRSFEPAFYRSSPRHISIGQLNALPRFHLRPINVIVYDVPYSFRMGDLILGRVSRLDAFSVYLVQT